MNMLCKISDEAINSIVENIIVEELQKGEKLIEQGQYAKNLHFICRGAVIGYITDLKGTDYVKSVFFEGDFPSAQVSLLRGIPSYMVLETIEDCTIISLNFKKFRALMEEYPSLKNFYIGYLEHSWIVQREGREVSLVMESAKKRYMDFIAKNPSIEARLKQKYIAAHLGITPTQLSRIKKSLNN